MDYLSRVALRHYGMEPDKDVKIIVTGESPTRLAALRAGSIDATAIDIAFAVKAEDEGYRRFLYLGDIQIIGEHLNRLGAVLFHEARAPDRGAHEPFDLIALILQFALHYGNP